MKAKILMVDNKQIDIECANFMNDEGTLMILKENGASQAIIAPGYWVMCREVTSSEEDPPSGRSRRRA